MWKKGWAYNGTLNRHDEVVENTEVSIDKVVLLIMINVHILLLFF